MGFSRLVGYFQEGLSYFTPKSLIKKARTEKISDRWEQVRLLGSGGFGVVWLVKEIGSGRLAVAKTPHSPRMNIRVLRSAAILKRLVHHPNIMQLLEIVKDGGRLIMIQEYVEGPTLQQLLEQGISPLDREAIFLQLVSVISYAHKHKILHRDIKPENIIISKSGRLKLLDFGIARDLSWQSPGTGSEGTVNFMPPEQFEGQSCIASDVWALGVILYIFATNAMPYFQQNDKYPVDIDTTVESRAPRKLNPQLDINLERIIMRCLQKDLEQRYQDATELLEDLRTSLPLFGRGELLPK
jgi:serine/threonine protein kinase